MIIIIKKEHTPILETDGLHLSLHKADNYKADILLSGDIFWHEMYVSFRGHSIIT